MESPSLPKTVLEIIDQLQYLKIKWKNSISNKTIYSISPDSGVNVRKDWLQIINNKFTKILIKHHYSKTFEIPEALLKEIFYFRDKVIPVLQSQKSITQADIDLIEEISNKVIAEFRKPEFS